MRISILLKRQKWDICCLLCCVAAYFANRYLFRPLDSFFRCYFNDLIAMPAMLAYINLCLGVMVNKEVATLRTTFYITAICAFFWEVVAIWVKPTAIFDSLDLLSYFIGATVYFGVKRKARRSYNHDR